jgi:trk system potassium uptake protein TrkA
MHIVILGAGQVGASVAESLASPKTTTSRWSTATRTAWRTAGSPRPPDGGRQRGLSLGAGQRRLRGRRSADRRDPERSDQSRCLQGGAQRLQRPGRIARLRARDFLDSEKCCPGELCRRLRLVSGAGDHRVHRAPDRLPRSATGAEFCRRSVVLVAVRAYAGGLLVGSPIKEMRNHLPPEIDGRIAAIYRREGAITPTGETVVEDGDEVFLLAAEEHIRAVMRELRRRWSPCSG